MSKSLSFEILRVANVRRCESLVFNHSLDSWSGAQWACALAGEVGELCNLIKKEFRGIDEVPREAIENEIADIQIYLDLLAARYGIDLGAVVVRKFNEVSVKRGSDITL
jgi:NTP pyrophosphatase (non-canonical NTP hydrolase)